jgi:hypothetical protein
MLVSLTVMIIVQLTPSMPSIFWIEPGESCAHYALWSAQARAYALRNRMPFGHGSCTVLYEEGYSDSQATRDIEARARDLSRTTRYLYMQLPEFAP